MSRNVRGRAVPSSPTLPPPSRDGLKVFPGVVKGAPTRHTRRWLRATALKPTQIRSSALQATDSTKLRALPGGAEPPGWRPRVPGKLFLSDIYVCTNPSPLPVKPSAIVLLGPGVPRKLGKRAWRERGQRTRRFAVPAPSQDSKSQRASRRQSAACGLVGGHRNLILYLGP